jgi:rhodanese-related sulfurtransferase
MWIAGERLIRGLYERRPAPILLRQAAAVFERSGGRPCAGLASVHNARAQLLAMEGRGDEAIAEVRNAEEVFAQLPSSVTQDIGSTLCYGEDRIRFTAAWVHAHLGQLGPLDDATDRAITVLGDADLRSATQVRLLQAAGYVRAGDIKGGVSHAMENYDRCPTEHRTVIMSRLAGEVWDAVPVERRKDPAITAYRELLSASGRKAIT